MSLPYLTKRVFLRIAAIAPFWLTSTVTAKDKYYKEAGEQGIGGTGQSLRGGDEDQGIGGTGIFGTIQRFGSIYVNDRRIIYSKDTPVFMDGVRVSVKSLKIGHVVRVVLDETRHELAARLISITSEVIGRVEIVQSDKIDVLSQTIELPKGIVKPPLRKGMTVAVHGIRKPDGTIVASRIESRTSGAKALLRGIAEQDSGKLRVGNLVIAQRPNGLSGRRVILDLSYKGDSLNLKRAVREDLVPGLQAGTVNVETFEERSGNRVRLGIGVTKAGTSSPITSQGSVYLDLTVSSGSVYRKQGSTADPSQNASPPRDSPPPEPRNGAEPRR